MNTSPSSTMLPKAIHTNSNKEIDVITITEKIKLKKGIIRILKSSVTYKSGNYYSDA